MAADFSRFEQYSRESIAFGNVIDPSALYDMAASRSLGALGLAYHYNGKVVSAVAPLHDQPAPDEYRAPVLKLVSAGSFKPVQEEDEYDEYTRVCAEQNVTDNGLRIGDRLMGFMNIRRVETKDPYEGNGGHDDFCLCGPCRMRILPIFGPEFVIVTYQGRSMTPERAMTVGQQVKHYDLKEELQVKAEGKEVKEYIIEEVIKKGVGSRTITRLPRLPSRRYKRVREVPVLSEPH